MTRRFIARPLALAAAALAVAGVAGVAAPAQAAEGVLIINGRPHPDPSGCIETPVPGFVDNQTDEVALIHAGPGCAGPLVAPVHSGEQATLPPGTSISIA